MLKNFGVVVPSYFVWGYNYRKREYTILTARVQKGVDDLEDPNYQTEAYNAYSTSELGLLLPKYIKYKGEELALTLEKQNDYFVASYNDGVDIAGDYDLMISSKLLKSEAQVRAGLLLEILKLGIYFI